MDDARILEAWRANAAPWTDAVRAGRIASRRQVTDRAIIDAVSAQRPHTVLDVGCGEGWLARALATRGMTVTGIDAVPALVEQARAGGGGDFRVLDYTALDTLGSRFDAAVCNFSLLGQQATDAVVRACGRLLEPGGVLIIQTLHPLMACGDAPYADGWREGSWAGIPGDFGEPAPWYFRTLESWVRLVDDAGLSVHALREPLHPDTGKPVSLLLTAWHGRT